MEPNTQFFGLNSLKDYSYYYYLPRLSFQAKKTLSDKIVEYEGKITFSLNHNSIIIIQRIKDLNSDDFDETIKAFGDIDFFHKNKVYHIEHNRSLRGNGLLCILLADLNIAITQYESEKITLDFLINNGLSKHTSKDALIAVLLNTEINKKTHYHEFQLINNSNNQEKEYDIPKYYSSICNDYSLFCTEDEKKLLKDYLIDKEMSVKEKGEEKRKDNRSKREKFENLQPYKDHTHCYLCKKVYNDYVIHLNSKLHCDNIKKYKTNFETIDSTFDRVRLFNKEQNELKEIANMTPSKKTKDPINEGGALIKSTSKTNETHKEETVIIKPLNITSLPQHETPLTQYGTNISGHNEIINTEKTTEKKYSKRKFAQFKTTSIFDNEDNTNNIHSSLKGTPLNIKNQL